MRLLLTALTALILAHTAQSEAGPNNIPIAASTKIWDQSQKKAEFRNGHERSFSIWSVVRAMSKCEALLQASSHLRQNAKEDLEKLNAELNTDFDAFNMMCGPFCLANSLNMLNDRGHEQLFSVVRNIRGLFPNFNKKLSESGMWAPEIIAVANNIKPAQITLSYHAATNTPDEQKPTAKERSLSAETLASIGKGSVALAVVRVGQFTSLRTYKSFFGEEYRSGVKPTDQAVWRQDSELFSSKLKFRDGGHFVVITAAEAIGENEFRLVIMDPLRDRLYEWRAALATIPEGSQVLRIFDSRYQPYLTIHPKKRDGQTQIVFEGSGVVLSDLIVLSER